VKKYLWFLFGIWLTTAGCGGGPIAINRLSCRLLPTFNAGICLAPASRWMVGLMTLTKSATSQMVMKGLSAGLDGMVLVGRMIVNGIERKFESVTVLSKYLLGFGICGGSCESTPRLSQFRRM
jgi:hypothetical protein